MDSEPALEINVSLMDCGTFSGDHLSWCCDDKFTKQDAKLISNSACEKGEHGLKQSLPVMSKK